MTPSPIFQFMVDNPWLAFFMAWPTSLVLISVAWCTTTLLTNTFSALLNVLSQTCALALTLIRGYPPKETLEGLANAKESSREIWNNEKRDDRASDSSQDR